MRDTKPNCYCLLYEGASEDDRMLCSDDVVAQGVSVAQGIDRQL